MSLREACTFRHGGTPSKSNPQFWGGDIPWVSPKDMKAFLITSTQDSITAEGVDGSAACVVPEGSILIVARSGILAHTVPVARAGRPLAFNQDIKAIQVTDNRVSGDYVYWFLRGKEAEILARGVKKGATVHSLQSGFLENLAIPIVSTSEQNRIVDLLSRAENIVRMRQEAEAKAKEIIPALFLDMFAGGVNSRIKGNGGRREAVRTVKLGDLFAQKPSYGTMIPAKKERERWLCLRVANIQGGRLTLADKKYVALPEDSIERHEVRSGDVLMARAIGSIDHLGKCFVADIVEGPWAFDSHLMRLRLNTDRLEPLWLQAYLSSEAGRASFLEKTRRTAVQFNINTGEMSSIVVPLPGIERQRAFVAHMRSLQAFEIQQSGATTRADQAFQSLLAGVFGESSST